jgi:hypothetical protein
MLLLYIFYVTEHELNTTVLGDPQTIHGNITNLKPYTTYMVAIAVITQSGEGLQSEPLYNTTLEAGKYCVLFCSVLFCSVCVKSGET